MIRNVAEVPSGVLKFSNLYLEFLEAGGETLKDEALKSDLYESLPSALRDQLLWHTISPDMLWDKFKDHVVGTAHRILHYSNHSPVHLADERVNTGRDARIEGLLAELKELGGDSSEDVLAIGGKRLCPNCGKTHPGPCRLPRKEPSDRTCWNCGKPGHTRANCPSPASDKGGPRLVRSVENRDSHDRDGGVQWFGCVTHGQDRDWETAMGRHSCKPMPSRMTLADFMPKCGNRFEALNPVEADLKVPAKERQQGLDEKARSRPPVFHRNHMSSASKGVDTVFFNL